MPIAKHIAAQLEHASWIRRMFEEGARLKQERGETNIFDFTLKRDVLCDGLAAAGYQVSKPEGGYYVFLKTPIPDDLVFIGLLLKEGVLAVPGAGFGRGGYIRLSLTVPLDTIERAMPGFQRARAAARG